MLYSARLALYSGYWGQQLYQVRGHKGSNSYHDLRDLWNWNHHTGPFGAGPEAFGDTGVCHQLHHRPDSLAGTWEQSQWNGGLES